MLNCFSHHLAVVCIRLTDFSKSFKTPLLPLQALPFCIRLPPPSIKTSILKTRNQPWHLLPRLPECHALPDQGFLSRLLISCGAVKTGLFHFYPFGKIVSSSQIPIFPSSCFSFSRRCSFHSTLSSRDFSSLYFCLLYRSSKSSESRFPVARTASIIDA